MVRCAGDGVEGLEAYEEFRPEVVVLDIMLPKLSGTEVLKEVRRRGEVTPVIMLTARDSVSDKVGSLSLGADDYLTKPFDLEELLARIEAVMRRARSEDILRVHDLEVDRAAREARRGSRRLGLTAREYDLLEFLARNRRRVFSREAILQHVWGQDFAAGTNVVDVYIGYLRKKVDGGPGDSKLIHTVRGVGYTLREG